MTDIVRVARTWMEVPYLHQGRNRLGVDCVGFPMAVYRELGVQIEDFRAYGLEADPADLLRRIEDALGAPVAVAPVRMSDLCAGDIVVFHFPKVGTPRHLAIIADRVGGGLNFMESNGNARRVVERRMDERYLARVTHVFRRPV